jgi:hypothetical protein
VYAWIWRKLPRGPYGKLIGSLVLLSAVVALLWFVIFPWAEPLLPFDDVQVGDPGSGYSDPDGPGGAVDPSGEPRPGPSGDGHELPYTPDSAVPAPTKTR